MVHWLDGESYALLDVGSSRGSSNFFKSDFSLFCAICHLKGGGYNYLIKNILVNP